MRASISCKYRICDARASSTSDWTVSRVESSIGIVCLSRNVDVAACVGGSQHELERCHGVAINQAKKITPPWELSHSSEQIPRSI